MTDDGDSEDLVEPCGDCGELEPLVECCACGRQVCDRCVQAEYESPGGGFFSYCRDCG